MVFSRYSAINILNEVYFEVWYWHFCGDEVTAVETVGTRNLKQNLIFFWFLEPTDPKIFECRDKKMLAIDIFFNSLYKELA